MRAQPVRATGIQAGYGSMTVLHDVSLAVESGGSLGIIGPNGAGKTTLLKALAGICPLTHGSLEIGGEDLSRLPAYKRVARGLALVPEGRQVIGTLTVQANLDITMFARRQMRADAEHQHRLERIFELFPKLADRRQQLASSLSGGEQQMLAFGRALMTRPEVLLVDEPSQGLAPKIVDQVAEVLHGLKGSITMIVVEQHRTLLEQVTDRVMAMRLGRVTEETPSGEPTDAV